MITRRQGLSPRGRGNRPRLGVSPAGGRSIPAWAGEPQCPEKCPPAWKVYPRVGGGTGQPGPMGFRHWGLSPRGRGNPCISIDGLRRRRSIPAWAGEPCTSSAFPTSSRVYPRVGGGTIPQSRDQSINEGLSPRGRGNHQDPPELVRVVGSIPAWAGEPRTGIGHPISGSIPAWAGEPKSSLRPPWPSGVYPRVGGGTHVEYINEVKVRGLSPRGRGNRHCPPTCHRWDRSIPAWAGEPAFPLP